MLRDAKLLGPTFTLVDVGEIVQVGRGRSGDLALMLRLLFLVAASKDFTLVALP